MSIASKTVIIWIHVVIWIIQISDFGFIRSFHFCPTTCIGSNRKRYPKSLKVSSLSSLNLLEENEFDVYSYTIKLRKPMGMILTEVSSSCNTGICVSSMMTSPTPGNAVLYNLEQMKNNAKNRQVLCLYDKILAVNGDACSNETFEQIMDRFAGISDDTDTELTLGKRKGSVAVQWPNGVCVRCMPGDSIGAAAQEAMIRIPYSCSAGSCGTCEQQVLNEDNGSRRYIRPCVARVPNGLEHMIVIPSDRY